MNSRGEDAPVRTNVLKDMQKAMKSNGLKLRGKINVSNLLIALLGFPCVEELSSGPPGSQAESSKE